MRPGVAAIVLAAGRSERMGRSKLYLSLQGRPLLLHSLERFDRSPLIDEMAVVINGAEVERFEKEILGRYQFQKELRIAIGGPKRQDSARAGMRVLSPSIDLVIVHDGARPFFSESLLEKLIEGAKQYQVAIPALPVKETVRGFDGQGFSTDEFDRSQLFGVQTPQCFSYGLLRRSLEEATMKGKYFADDAGAVAAITGVKAKLVAGEERNIKITTSQDLKVAMTLVEQDID